MGNITKVVSGTDTLAEYTYDNQNQLVSEDDGQYLTTYTYDTYGNIRSIWVRDSETYSAVLETYEFSYADDRDWKDQLTGVTYTDYNSDGKESGMLTYDAMGNPLTYFNVKKSWSFTWKYGRQLASAADGTHTITNAYDVDGVRESKTVDGVEHKYVTLDGKIIRETYGTVTVDYFYDNEGRPYKLVVDEDNSTSGGSYTGYFVLNQQGDVIAILNANGAKAVSYEYNAWGQILSEDATTEVAGALFLKYNALKYRGYYYDDETGFYYVSSRYYDPVIGRFINADTTDVLTISPTSLTDKNLYTYCDNNPVMRVDEDGEYWNIAAGAIIGGVISAAFEAANQLISSKTTGSSFDVGAVVAAGMSGAIVGGFTASGLGRKGQAIGQALGSIVTDTYSHLKSGSDFGTAVMDIGCNALKAAREGYKGGPGLRAKGTQFSELLSKNSSIRTKIKNGGYKTLSAGAKRLRQNLSALNQVKRNVTVKKTKKTISNYAMDYIKRYIPTAYNWVKSNW